MDGFDIEILLSFFVAFFVSHSPALQHPLALELLGTQLKLLTQDIFPPFCISPIVRSFPKQG
jgi:hypothetical protein